MSRCHSGVAGAVHSIHPQKHHQLTVLAICRMSYLYRLLEIRNRSISSNICNRWWMPLSVNFTFRKWDAVFISEEASLPLYTAFSSAFCPTHDHQSSERGRRYGQPPPLCLPSAPLTHSEKGKGGHSICLQSALSLHQCDVLNARSKCLVTFAALPSACACVFVVISPLHLPFGSSALVVCCVDVDGVTCCCTQILL